MKCIKCHKPIIHEDDWGDYDDACEWACTCTAEERAEEEQFNYGFNELYHEELEAKA